MLNKKKFKIPKVKPPTEAEMKVVAKNWWKHHIGINFADWNETLRDNSFPYRICKLSKSLINETLKFADCKGDFESTLMKYGEIIYPALVEMDCEKAFFIKLISRSPKDVLADENNEGKPKALNTFPDALNAILNSMRCFEDLCMLIYLPDHAALIVRPYIDFKPSDEWRVYIKDKKIIGISQYYYQSVFPHLDNEHIMKAIKEEITNIIYSIVVPNLKLNDYVVDVVMGDGGSRKTSILEINPYGLSDPCLFKNYNSFDGTIVWNKHINDTSKIKL